MLGGSAGGAAALADGATSCWPMPPSVPREPRRSRAREAQRRAASDLTEAARRPTSTTCAWNEACPAATISAYRPTCARFAAARQDGERMGDAIRDVAAGPPRVAHPAAAGRCGRRATGARRPRSVRSIASASPRGSSSATSPRCLDLPRAARQLPDTLDVDEVEALLEAPGRDHARCGSATARCWSCCTPAGCA